MKTVNLKGQGWATENYNEVTFRYADTIPFAKTPEDFVYYNKGNISEMVKYYKV